jgi:4-hydroxy-3-polyprenylbenzoate decarboxylase
LPLTVAITGASGVIYGVELLKTLHRLGQPPYLVVSRAAWCTLALETNYRPQDLKQLALASFEEEELAAPLASGSFAVQGMVVAPCSIKSLSAIAHSFTHNLIIRAADCCLKERRPLVLMVRETPLHLGHLRLLEQAASLGAIILPPMPAFYHKPSSLEDIIRHSVGKALDQFGIDHQLYQPWTGAD